MLIKVSDYVIKRLEETGVKHMFMLPGGGAMHLNDSLGKSEKIQFVCSQMEMGAAIAAEAYARVNNCLGLLMVTTGPGGTNAITGIAGHKGFCIVSVEKDMMNAELGFGRRVLQAFEEYGINFEHLPTGIDTMCVVVHEKELNPHREEVLARIQELVQPDTLTVSDHLALIATVGRGMVRNFGTAARLFTAISSQGISIRTIDQGSSELNIIVGVDEEDFEAAVKAIYDTFVRI